MFKGTKVKPRCGKHRMTSGHGADFSICLKCGYSVDNVSPEPPSESRVVATIEKPPRGPSPHLIRPGDGSPAQRVGRCTECANLAALWYTRKRGLAWWICEKCEEERE